MDKINLISVLNIHQEKSAVIIYVATYYRKTRTEEPVIFLDRLKWPIYMHKLVLM